MNRTLRELGEDCKKRGVSLDRPYSEFSRRELINKLGDSHWGESKRTWGYTYRRKIESPMLCFNFKDLKESEQNQLNKGDNWIVELKENGCRVIITYHPEEGFNVFSRNISVEDYLPVDYSDKVLWVKDGKVSRGEDWKGVFKNPFVLDGEVIATGNIDTTSYTYRGGETGTTLDAVSALLSISKEACHEIQKTQAQLKFRVWDILWAGSLGDVREKTLRERKVLLKKVVDRLGDLPIEEVEHWSSNRDAKYKEIIASGREGVVYKNLDMPYISTESRRRNTQVKRKRSMRETVGSDIDAFITGYVPAKDGQWKDEGLIGGLKLSVLLQTEEGESEHWICTVGSIPYELRKRMTVSSLSGPILKEEFYGRVVVVNGQDVSSKSMRFAHATIDWDRGFRKDKTRFECVFSEEILKAAIL